MASKSRRKRDSIRLSRYRDTSSDTRLTQREMALTLAWQTPADQRTAEQTALLVGEGWERAAPVQHESAEMAALWQGVKTRWWRPGWWRWEAAVWRDDEARRRSREGVRPGWPDCGLMIPRLPGRIRSSVHAALELKSPALKPKRDVAADWWLADFDSESRYGVSREQQAVLRCLDAMGWRTMVAFSAAEALEWLDAVAGPRPERLPPVWDYWTRGERL